MAVTLGILIAVWFLAWGIMRFTGRGRLGDVFLGVVAIIIGLVGLFGPLVVGR